MVAERGKFPPEWKKMAGEKVEYRKKVGAYEMRAVETEGFCEKCSKKGLGFSFRTVDSRGDYLGKSGAYWCPACGEGMSPEAYEGFVKNELITPEM
jgi:hypothetical protein